MNYTFVVLGVILVILLYILYVFFTQGKTELASYRSLAGVETKLSTLLDPTADNYHILIWLYVTKFPASSTPIYSIDSTKLLLQLDSAGTLSYAVTTSPTKTVTTIITDNFPLERWSCVVLSVTGLGVDSYLDGKLIKSQSIATIKPTSTSSIKEGTNKNIFIAKFERIPGVINPSVAWDKYMAGNGGNPLYNFLKRFGVNLILSKDSTEQSRITFPDLP